jgi:sulfite oxidase
VIVVYACNQLLRAHGDLFQMNGNPLPARHGAPVRSIIPGIIGARSVKWLDTIVISARESQNHYQQHDYKVLPPSATSPQRAEELGVWDSTPAMQDNPINSVVAVPANDGDILQRDSQSRIKIAGYAIPQGKDGPVEKVEVSIDKGKTWVEARLLDDGDENTTHPSNMHRDKPRGKFSWVLWEVEIEVGKDGPRPKEGECEGVSVVVDIWSKATDRGGNTMKEDQPEGDWNLRGVGYNAVQGRTGVRIL